jgi:predicted RNA-binding Zn-ribbon protein involved in translation (DUF1610 family)
MPVTDATPDSTEERANELYWDSGHIIDEIVKELKMSRTALYAAVRPRDAATRCPECGEAMAFTNRTNRDARLATCPACGTEAPAAEAGPAAPSATDETDEPVPPGVWRRVRVDLSAIPRRRVAMVGGAALLGVMVGAATARFVREMM